MSEELKPCPFCGSDAHIEGGEDYGFYATCCSAECFCCVGEAYDRSAMPEHMFADRDAARDAWNRRALSSPRVERARALEEAAAIAEGYMRDLSNPIFARACAENIASRIRSLSPQGG